MTHTFDLYLSLERIMMDLDDEQSEDAHTLADKLRDLMDPLWVAMSPEEHAVLDARKP